LVEWIVVITAAAATAVVVRTLMLQLFYIPSESMAHTLEVDDKVMVDKVSHRVTGVQRGDIVVFHRPANLQGSGVNELVKRVIAVEGDTIEAINGTVYVNDVAIDEPYLVKQGSTRNLPRTTVGAGHLFMMGDNRERSSDSRVFGPIAENSVVGHARAIVMRHGRLHVERP
jgi:signal peptidase I